MERFWRSVNYAEVYRQTYDSVNEAQKGLERYVMRDTQPRGGRTRRLTAKPPDACYVENVPTLPKTA